ncbi:helix-turn-helix domain-containing protein [Micromonospora sp. DR5-3]|uniref:AraC-like ligand-binding domain-containing protein n=1 Tax=unclassified Micromonospora TaxID=2617518 RepID=UPI0011DADF11|nr:MULTISPECIES: helix-turn-helix domain-containing protein [unclassified Micromonospora]MCW3819002.1 helix-turn-helix domain-containing protein [Micromonospora sp. DR5-3]TYC21016.1 helix-turn-helix domain-containing protein [Micromonospora sp. MP36]
MVILAVASVDTAWLPPAERFDFWLDLVARESVAARISSAYVDNFTASARAVDLGVVRLGRWRYPPLELSRMPGMIRSSDPELFHLALPLSGHGVVWQQRRAGPLGPAGFTLIDTLRPHGSQHALDPATAAPVETLTVLLPYQALPLSARRVEALLAADIPADRGMGALLAAFLRRIVAQPEEYAADDAPQLGRIALDLISGTLAGRLDVERELPVEVQETGLRARVEVFVRRHLSDPALTPATVAAAHHMSLRSLHRLFEGTGTTVGAMIRTERLAGCFRDLADPRLRHLAVHQVAARWGFRDRAHFSRAFRSAYGLSPREHRERGPLG